MKSIGLLLVFLFALLILFEQSGWGFQGDSKNKSSVSVSSVSQGITAKLPPRLTWDFYPNGLTREESLKQIPNAIRKTGFINSDETWSGVIHITGDIQIDPTYSVTINPGTLVLVAARSDDRKSGIDGAIDQFNPKDPPYVGSERTEILVWGSLIINGTRENPVIITSDAVNPQNDDWGGLNLVPFAGSKVEITRAIIEFTRTIGISSSDVVIRQSILRNMMECVIVGHIIMTLEDVFNLRPTLTQNYIYNGGRHMVSVRNGSPTISHNIILARPDMDTTGWEQGALGVDFPSCVNVHHNYLDGGQPRLYQGEIFGRYQEYTVPSGASVRGICPFIFEFNTVTGSPLALESHAGEWSISDNNLIPVPATGRAAEDPTSLQNSWNKSLWANAGFPEESDEWQFEFLNRYGWPPLVDVFSCPDNWFGTDDPIEIEKRLIGLGVSGFRFDYQPFRTDFITDALPNWREFEWKDQYELTLSRAGTGNGTVTSSPAGIHCKEDCSETYPSGTSVALTANADAGSIFAGWNGGGCSGTGPCVVMMDTDIFITAIFNLQQYSLTVVKSGTGDGTVTSSPAGINCGTDCSESYDQGTSVTLTATAASGSSFGGWSGDANGSTNPVTVTIDGNKTVTANFTQDQYTLTVNISPPGAGVVTKVPDKTTYVYGDVVTLTAADNPGYTFSNWNGDASGPAKPITITMNNNKTITANFTQNQYTLTMNINPTGSGSVTRNPNKSTYVYGDVVELTANAATGYSFSSWSGDASGVTNPVTLTIDNNNTVTANFTELIGPDLTGLWTTPVTQTCKDTKKGPKCTIKGVLTINNNGNRDASSSTVRFYLSDSNTYDQADTPLMSAATGKIKAKQSKSIKLSKTFPLGQIVTDKYVVAVIDKYNSVAEVDEANNIIVFGPID